MLVFLAQPETSLDDDGCEEFASQTPADSPCESALLFNNSEICSRIVIPEMMVFARRLLLPGYNNAGSCSSVAICNCKADALHLPVSAGEWRITNQRTPQLGEAG